MIKILRIIEQINMQVNNIVWGPVMLTFIVIIGFMFTIRSKFFQVRKIKMLFEATLLSCLKKREKGKGGLSAFQAMTTSLAGAMGTGNIVGVATALALGGPGAVFWMWIASILSMMTIFAENVLGALYKSTDKNGNPIGGPMYYISKGLKNKPLAVLFCGACICSSFGMGNMAQTNSIASALETGFNVPTIISGAVIILLTALIIVGGIKRVATVTESMVPFMTIFFMLGGLIVIIVNMGSMPKVITDIYKGAFDISAAGGGISGYVMANAIKQGISKGVFSNEAGLGSSPIVYSVSDIKNPVEQGMWGIFQVFIDTIVGCTITALCILSTGSLASGKEGVELSAEAFTGVFGKFGNVFVCICIVLFAFATLISWSYYGEQCLKYLTEGKGIKFYRVVYCLMAGVGCMIKLNIVWDISDTFNGLMAIPNLIALLFLSNQVINVIKNYDKNKLKKQNTAFIRSANKQRLKV